MTDHRPPTTAAGPARRARRTRPSTAALAAALLALAAGCSGDDGSTAPTTTATTEPPPTTTTTEAAVDAGERIYVYEPSVGDCFDRRTLEQEEGGERIVLLLDCELPHQFEVYAVVEIDSAALPPPTTVTTSTTAPPAPAPSTTLDPEGNPVGSGEPGGTAPTTLPTTTTVAPSDLWPGQDVLERFARQTCPGPFDAWVGTPYELSTLEIAWVLPEESAWNNGERTLGCTVYDPAVERLAGSQAGSGR